MSLKVNYLDPEYGVVLYGLTIQSLLLYSGCVLVNIMLAFLTEKLQKQTLDDSAQSSSGPIRISQDNSVLTSQTTVPVSNTLSVKGKNVWALSIDTSSHCSYSHSRQDIGKRIGRGNKGIKPTNQNAACDMSPSTPNAPPPKKHCRSLSVPPGHWAPETFQPFFFRPVPVMVNDLNNHSIKFSAQGQMRDSSVSRSNINRSFINSSSPVSVDSGHVTSSDFQTPPGSPVPRPSSATSELSHNSYWFEQSPFKCNRFEILQNRSLSCEDRISNRPLSGSSSHGLDSLSHSSPSRISRIPRCKSQPCVLHDRKCGKKRRHDYDRRPTLDFTKMTETAYNSPASTKPIPFSHIQKRSLRDDGETVGRLVPIASSPLDTDIPLKGLDNLPTSPIDDVSSSTSQSLSVQGHYGSSNENEPIEFVDSGLDECDCRDNRGDLDQEIIFPLKDLDMDEIEKH